MALDIEAMTPLIDVADKWWTAWCLEGLAEVAVSGSQPTRTATLFGAAADLRKEIGAPRPTAFLDYYERDLAAARGQLDELAFRAAWVEGAAMSLEEVSEHALEHQATVEPGVPVDSPSYQSARLTGREVGVLVLLANGLTDGQVARELHISPRTVGRHLGSIYKKLGVPGRAAARKAAERNLI